MARTNSHSLVSHIRHDEGNCKGMLDKLIRNESRNFLRKESAYNPKPRYLRARIPFSDMVTMDVYSDGLVF